MLKGVVIDENGRAVPGAKIELEIPFIRTLTTESDAAGRFRIFVTDRSLQNRIRVTHETGISGGMLGYTHSGVGIDLVAQLHSGPHLTGCEGMTATYTHSPGTMLLVGPTFTSSDLADRPIACH